MPQYNWNIVESGVKHHSSNPKSWKFVNQKFLLKLYAKGYYLGQWNHSSYFGFVLLNRYFF